jgi:hypothetical protein
LQQNVSAAEQKKKYRRSRTEQAEIIRCKINHIYAISRCIKINNEYGTKCKPKTSLYLIAVSRSTYDASTTQDSYQQPTSFQKNRSAYS